MLLPKWRRGDFNDLTGPWYFKDEGGRLVGGFRVQPQHLNPNGVCHGGMLATFCDFYLAMAGLYQTEIARVMAPTVSLSIDFLEPTPAGAWVEGRAELLRAGRRMLFVQGLVTVEGRATVRASGAFTVPSSSPIPEADVLRYREGMRALLRGAV